MDGIRAKITPGFEPDGSVRLRIEWVEVKGGHVGEPLAGEEFRLAPHRQGCAYVSRAVFPAGEFLPGPFWLDEGGRRHFRLDAEAGVVGLTGAGIGG